MPLQLGTPFDRATRGLTRGATARATRGLWIEIETPVKLFKTPDAVLMVPAFATASVSVPGENPISSLDVLSYLVSVVVTDPEIGVAYTRKNNEH